jgi:hypothetical protein
MERVSWLRTDDYLSAVTLALLGPGVLLGGREILLLIVTYKLPHLFRAGKNFLDAKCQMHIQGSRIERHVLERY